MLVAVAVLRCICLQQTHQLSLLVQPLELWAVQLLVVLWALQQERQEMVAPCPQLIL
jgi:hypothetical protein